MMYTTEIESQNAQQEEFEYLVSSRHIDDEDGLEYVVTRVGKLWWRGERHGSTDMKVMRSQ